jgi:hypothetical protein
MKLRHQQLWSTVGLLLSFNKFNFAGTPPGEFWKKLSTYAWASMATLKTWLPNQSSWLNLVSPKN